MRRRSNGELTIARRRPRLCRARARRPSAQSMTSRNDILLEITPQVLLKAYAVGIFPMAESAEDPGLYWIEPEMRGILPLDRFHLPRRLRRTVAQGVFEVRIDHDFDAVIDGCAAPAAGRAQDLDQRAHPPALWRTLRPRPLPHGRDLAGRSAGRRPLRHRARRRLLRREHVQPRARCLEGGARPSRRRGSGPAASGSSTPSSPPRT